MAFGREALDIRHRLPDHKGQGVWRCYGQHQPLISGLLLPRTVRTGPIARMG